MLTLPTKCYNHKSSHSLPGEEIPAFKTLCSESESQRTYDLFHLFSRMFDQASSSLERKIEILERPEDNIEPFVKQLPLSLAHPCNPEGKRCL